MFQTLNYIHDFYFIFEIHRVRTIVWMMLNRDRSSSGGHLVGLLLLGLAPDFRISFLLGFIFF